MKLYNREKTDLLNYLLMTDGKPPLFRNYKLIVKNAGCNARCPMCDDWKENGDRKRLRANLFAAFAQILEEKIPKKHVQIL